MFNQETTRVSWFKAPISSVRDESGNVVKKANQKPNKNPLSIYQTYRLIIGEGEKNPLPSLTESLRKISDPDPKKAHDLRGEFKRQNLPFITFGGEFSYRAIKDLTTASGLVCLDIDGQDQTPNLTPEDIGPLRERLSQDPDLSSVLLFRSPSGDGLKVVINTRQEIRNDSDFKRAYRSIENYVRQKYNIVSDPARKDIAGACFLCYDEEAVLNQAGAGFDVERWVPVEAPKPQPQRQAPIRPTTFSEEPDDYTRALIAVEDIENSGIDITSDRGQWVRIGFALATLGEAGRELFHRVSRFFPQYNETETNTQFSSFLRSGGNGVNLESLFAIAKEHGVPLRSSNVYSQRPQKGAKSGGSQVEATPPPSEPVEAPQMGGNQAPDEEEMTRLRGLLTPTTESAIIERGKHRPPSLSTGYLVKQNGTSQRLRLPSGKLTEIAGATGHGKTLFLLNLLLNVARLNPDRRFVLFTYEEDSDTIIGYLLNIYLSDLNLMRGGDWRTNRILIDEYLKGEGTTNFNPSSVPEFLRRKDLFFRQYIETGRILVNYVESDSSELCRSIRFLSAPENNIGGVFVDYFQYINPDPKKKFPTRQEALKNICIELKDIATETQLPVVLACQFNQEVLAPTDVLLNKIGEAGDISRIGSECWGLWQMGKDIGRKLDNKDEQRVNDLEQKSQTLSLSDPFLKGMFIRVLKSRFVETGAEEMMRFRGLTGKIYPNDPEEETLSVEEWNRPDPNLGLTDDDDLPM